MTTTINNRTFKVTDRTCLIGSNINKVNSNIVASVILSGKRGACKMAYELKDGTYDIIGSL